MAEAGHVTIRLLGDSTKFQAALRSSVNSLKKFEDTAKEVTMKAGVAFAALAVGITKVTGTFAEFDRGMRRAGAIAGADPLQTEALSAKATELAKSTKFSASEVTKAYQFMAMAGQDTNTIMASIGPTLQLAAAGALDLGLAADITTGVMASFGKRADELTDVNNILAKVITSTKTDVSGLGQSFQKVGAIAQSSGVGFQEMTVALGLLGQQNLIGAEAGTAMKTAIARMLNPIGSAKDEVKKLGVTFKEADGTLRPLVDIIRDLEQSGADATSMVKIFGTRGMLPMSILANQGAAEFEKLNTKLNNHGNIAEKLANDEMATLSGRLNSMRASIEGAVIALGRGMEPILRVLIATVAKLADIFASIPGPIQKIIGTVAVLVTGLTGLAAAFGAVSLAALALVGAWPKLIAGMAALTANASALAVGLGTYLTTSIAAAATSMKALGAASIKTLAVQAWGTATAGVSAFAVAVKGAAIAMAGFGKKALLALAPILPVLAAVGAAVAGMVLGVGALRLVWIEFGGGIRKAVGGAFDYIGKKFAKLVSWLKDTEWLQGIKQAITGTVAAFLSGFLKIIATVKWAGREIANRLQAIFDRKWSVATSSLDTAGLDRELDKANIKASDLADTLAGAASTAGKAIAYVATETGKDIGFGIKKSYESFQDLWDEIKAGFKSLFEDKKEPFVGPPLPPNFGKGGGRDGGGRDGGAGFNDKAAMAAVRLRNANEQLAWKWEDLAKIFEEEARRVSELEQSLTGRLQLWFESFKLPTIAESGALGAVKKMTKELAANLASTIGGALQEAAPRFTRVLNAAIEGFSAGGGPMGAAIAGLVALAVELETVQELFKILEVVIDKIVKPIDQMLRPLTSAVGGLLRSITGMDDAAKEADKTLRNLGKKVSDSMLTALEMVSKAATGHLGDLREVTGLTKEQAEENAQKFYDTLFSSMEAMGLGSEEMLRAIDQLVKDLQNQLILASMGMLDMSPEEMERIQAQIAYLQELSADINSGMEDAANAIGDGSGAIQDAADKMVETLANVPSGFKVALARFQAIAGEDGSVSTAAMPPVGGGITSGPTSGVATLPNPVVNNNQTVIVENVEVSAETLGGIVASIMEAAQAQMANNQDVNQSATNPPASTADPSSMVTDAVSGLTDGLFNW